MKFHYGHEYPVARRRMFRRAATFLVTGTAAIAMFFAIIAATITMLPAAIDAELDRRIAIVEQHLGGGR